MLETVVFLKYMWPWVHYGLYIHMHEARSVLFLDNSFISEKTISVWICKKNIALKISYKIVALFTENYPSCSQLQSLFNHICIWTTCYWMNTHYIFQINFSLHVAPRLVSTIYSSCELERDHPFLYFFVLSLLKSLFRILCPSTSKQFNNATRLLVCSRHHLSCRVMMTYNLSLIWIKSRENQ